MKHISIVIFFLSLLFAQNEIEGRWHLVGYEDNVMYQFEDNYRYSIYSTDGNFGGLEDAGNSPNPYTVEEDIITIDLFFGTIVNYQMNYRCDGQVVEFIYIPDEIIHSTLFREGYNFIDNECEEVLEECFDFTDIDFGECEMVLGVGLLNDECSYISGCDWTIDGIDYSDLFFDSMDECEEVCDTDYQIDLGDLNDDGSLNILDIILMVGMIMDEEPYDQIADLNQDGSINILDIIALLNLILNPATSCEDIDGNVYETVQIGEQVWMAENLKVTHYNNGDAILTGYSDVEWSWLDSGAYAVYDDNPANVDIYGNLYNWYTVVDERGMCADGWHVPSDTEFMELEMFLGMSESEANSTGSRGTNEGSKLAGRADLWNSGSLEENIEFGTSGFTGFPAGNRDYGNGNYNSMSFFGAFWSSTESNSFTAWNRELEYHSSIVYRFNATKQFGFSIRCIQD